MRADQEDYGRSLDHLAESHPRLATPLRRAHDHRMKDLAVLRTGARFAGLEQLLRHLDSLAIAWTASRALRGIQPLLARAIGDFESGLEATLSGQRGIVADLMRDVTEIELLLLDFSMNDSRIDEWRSADRRYRLRHFSPARMRERLEAEAAGRYNPHRIDYAAHSEALHVTPMSHPFATRGIASDDDSLLADLGFWEMFEHARRLLIAIEALHDSIDEPMPRSLARREDLKAVESAWDRTQEMQGLFLALLEATRQETPDVTNDPVDADPSADRPPVASRAADHR